jgi:hypothetical protein
MARGLPEKQQNYKITKSRFLTRRESIAEELFRPFVKAIEWLSKSIVICYQSERAGTNENLDYYVLSMKVI